MLPAFYSVEKNHAQLAVTEYIADILPATARQVESAKAAMLEGFRVAGYELVLPPMVEYIDSLVSEEDASWG